MGSYSDGKLLPHFTSAELLMDKFSNFFMKKTSIIRDKIISDSPKISSKISTDADIMFNIRNVSTDFWG